MIISQVPGSGRIDPSTILDPYTTASGWAMGVGSGLVVLLAVAALFGFLIRKYSS